MAAVFDFDIRLSNADFTSDTVDKLVCAKIHDLDSLCLLSQYDVTALKLEIGDRGKFRQALRKLREQFPDDDEDLLNASTSSRPDDSSDCGDPEQVALQQRLQKEQARRDCEKNTESSDQQPSASGGLSSEVSSVQQKPNIGCLP
jgi:hypothetical protein